MLVYRLERNGIGPYQRTNYTAQDIDICYELMEAHIDHNHPCPYEDGLDKIYDDKTWFFGCDSEQSLRDWFGPFWIEKLAKIGFEIKSYRARKYEYGRSGDQLIFRKA